MCGIAGFWETPRTMAADALERTARAMADSMPHRGPDDWGVWSDAPAGIALSQRRLSIVDLSPEGHQPMLSRCGRYAIVFNGEIYNHRALRRRLEGSGAAFRGHSDTEVMLAAIAEWGLERSLESFNGMFAFALWDRLERRLHLARDRAGEKPLYYARFGGSFLFASELKALRAHPAFRGDIDREALTLFLRFGYIPSPHSIYRGVSKLPPATTLTIDAGAPLATPRAYWSARDAAERGLASPLAGSSDEIVEQLDELLRDAVKLRMEADVPLGAFLSGGVDSSTVVALMQAQSSRPVRTFTIGFHESSYNEADQAELVARHLGTEHTELYITPAEAMAVIPRLPSIYDEPFADSSQVPTTLVSHMARRHVTVSLSGDGGDELFGGYVRYLWAESIWRRTGRWPAGTKQLASRLVRSVPATAWDSLFGVLNPMLPGRLRQRNPGHKLHQLAEVITAASPDAMYLALVSQWKDPARIVLGAREPRTQLSRGSGDAFNFVQRMMYLDTVTYLPDDILVKMDRASMSASLEARVPMLDHRLIELAWRVPQDFKIREGRGKWLLRQVLNRYVPEALIERPKMGFGMPIDQWLRGPLRPWAEELLDESRLRQEGFLDPKPIRRKWTEHLGGSRNWQYYLWSILMFQAWLEQARRDAPSELREAVSR
ncbi:MAG: asparagine synthase (glutamine-hydrolyzing) [Bryobacteraceae bacterium]